MSRVTPPVTKFTLVLRKCMSTTSTVASPSAQLKTKSAIKPDLISNFSHERTITTTHRPSPPSIKTIRLMQGFRTSAVRPVASPSTLDYLVLPRLPVEEPLNAFTVRVPILPDNYYASQPIKESIDTAIPKQEVHIVSAQPEEVVAQVNVLTEMVGNEAESAVDLGQWVEGVRKRGEEMRERFVGRDSEQSVLRELWMSLREDVWGEKKVAV